VVGIAVMVALLPVDPTSADEGWRELLEGAADAAHTRPYAGETMLLSTAEGQPHLSRVQVAHTPASGLLVGADDALRLEADPGGGALLDEGERWVAGPPGIDVDAGDDFARLERKYDVAVERTDRLMDRPCTMIAITRRADSALVERLWIDDESGLLVRRETFDGGEEPVRLAAYLSLDLDPRRVRAAISRTRPTPPPRPAIAPAPLDGRELAVLEEAGWVVPGPLPDGYEPVGVFAVDAVESQPLQLVYGDGLYVVSLFQQQGRPDWSSLPDGAVRVDGVDHPVWAWPGAQPQRLVWEADGRTWSLIGDAPASDLLHLVEAMPTPDEPGPAERLRRGFGRLWSWVTPWGQD
jgi:sigma-E factor negative regulatory protein RseB